jgi:hypothetical protein
MAGPQKTARQKLLHSKKEAAAGRAVLSPGNGQSKFEFRLWVERIGVKEQADLKQPGDANACQSTVCRLPKHHTTQSEYLLNQCPTSTLIYKLMLQVLIVIPPV